MIPARGVTEDRKPGHGPTPEEIAAALACAGGLADRREVGLWLVGGALRDLLLGRRLNDLDFSVEAAAAKAIEFATRLSAQTGWTLGRTHARFGTATLQAPGGMRVDVAATRREEYPAPASLPVVTGTATIEDDLARRDFTIHAMARRVERRGLVGRTLDPFAGREDLTAKALRLLHPKSLVDDPTRAYRAVKYAARLGFAWDGEFLRALKAARAAGAFAALSGDRMRRGIEEIFLESNWSEAQALEAELELFGDVLPGWKSPLLPSKKRPAAPAAPGSVDALHEANTRPKPEEIWRRLLEPLPPPDRSAVASRLNFPKALRRAAGAAPR